MTRGAALQKRLAWEAEVEEAELLVNEIIPEKVSAATGRDTDGSFVEIGIKDAHKGVEAFKKALLELADDA